MGMRVSFRHSNMVCASVMSQLVTFIIGVWWLILMGDALSRVVLPVPTVLVLLVLGFMFLCGIISLVFSRK